MLKRRWHNYSYHKISTAWLKQAIIISISPLLYSFVVITAIYSFLPSEPRQRFHFRNTTNNSPRLRKIYYALVVTIILGYCRAGATTLDLRGL